MEFIELLKALILGFVEGMRNLHLNHLQGI